MTGPFDRPSAALFRRLVRPSAAARALWIAVAALHAVLLLQRLTAGEGAGAWPILRAGLTLAAIGYATLKVWNVATLLDSDRRRAVLFGLLLTLGHVAISPRAPDLSAALGGARGAVPAVLWALPPVVFAAVALGAALLLRRRLPSTPPPHPLSRETAAAAVPPVLAYAAILPRPPPSRCSMCR